MLCCCFAPALHLLSRRVQRTLLPWLVLCDEHVSSVLCLKCLGHFAGDETLRFWSVFPGAKVAGSADESAVSNMMRAHIR